MERSSLVVRRRDALRAPPSASMSDLAMKARMLAIVSASAVAAACGDEETVPVQRVKITFAATALLENVDLLGLRMGPTILQRSDGGTTAVITSNSGQNQAGVTCTHGIAGEPLQCTTDQGFQPFVDTTPINATDPWLTQPLSSGQLAVDFSIPHATCTSVSIAAISVPQTRDSYLQLTDGRECEVEFRSTDGSADITFPMSLQVGPDEDWHVSLRIDLSVNHIDPAQCAQGYVLIAVPAGSEAARYKPS